MLSRRFILGGLASGLLGPLWAGAPTRSAIPVSRPLNWARQAIPSADEIIAAAANSGKVAFAVADVRTRQILETRTPLLAQPPASVTKTITALYGLQSLGDGFQFRTQLIATGPIRNGRLDGDLVLQGTGDPQLDTDGLVKLALALKATGMRKMTGQFRIASDALPYIRAIDPSQPDHVGYNPSISGLNLNFNRVYFEWKRRASAYDVSMDARSDSVRPSVTMTRVAVANRNLPVYAYAQRGEVEYWTVARTALGNDGGRWLPVRNPSAYAAGVFQTLARSYGLELQIGDPVSGRAQGTVIAEERSAELKPLLRAMLRYSTNITAETIGLTATLRDRGRPETLSSSAEAMSAWVAKNLDANHAKFVDHSGLNGASRISPNAMVQALTGTGVPATLRELLQPIHLTDRTGEASQRGDAHVVAKTGTLNFVSSLAGYIRTKGGRDLVFAVFCADMSRREGLSRDERENPSGSRRWALSARRLQDDLLRRWVVMHDL